MFHKLDEVVQRFEEINHQLQDPQVTSNQDRYRSLMKEMSSLEEIVTTYKSYRQNEDELQGCVQILEQESDEGLREMAKEDLSRLQAEKEEFEKNLKILLLPKDPNDDKNIILEIRAGAGGDEASLFADELFRSYMHYASSQGWKVELLSLSHGNAGGVREVVASISGDKVFSRLKYESGVHRVQRVPKTESQGRVHTSTITVAVIPEAEEKEVVVNAKDVRIDVMRASGAGGQSVNTTDSAVRLTHMPTGIVIYSQEEKSQLSNKEKAFKVLYAKLRQLEEDRLTKEASDQRLAQIGTGDRSERIRTYNFPQSRVTDHRIGLTVHNLSEIMNGHISEVIDALTAHYQSEELKRQTSH